jgi:hypothetical protein
MIYFDLSISISHKKGFEWKKDIHLEIRAGVVTLSGYYHRLPNSFILSGLKSLPFRNSI